VPPGRCARHGDQCRHLSTSALSNCNVGVNLTGSGSSEVSYSVTNNTSIAAKSGTGVNAVSFDAAVLDGTISGNSIASTTTNNVGAGIDLIVENGGSATTTISGNTISGYSVGLRAGARNPATGTADVTLSNNTITSGGNNASFAVWLLSGNGSGGESNDLSVHLSGNDANAGSDPDYFLEQYDGNTFCISGLTGDGTDAINVQNYVAGTDPGSSVLVATPDDFGAFVDYTACAP